MIRIGSLHCDLCRFKSGYGAIWVARVLGERTSIDERLQKDIGSIHRSQHGIAPRNDAGILMTQRRAKKCKVCRQEFQLWNSLQKACSVECALALVRIEAAKKEKRQLRADRENLKTARDYIKTAGGIQCLYTSQRLRKTLHQL